MPSSLDKEAESNSYRAMQQMVESRQTFYWLWIKRAFQGRVLQVELISGLLSLIAVPVGLWLWPNESGSMNWVPLFIFLTLLILAVLWGLMAAPYGIFLELTAEKKLLQSKLDNREARQLAIQKLWELRASGVPHRNVYVEPRAEEEWTRKFDEWRGEVLCAAGDISANLKAWLETLDVLRPEPEDLGTAASLAHSKRRASMTEMLRRMQEFLQAEMMNKDIERDSY